MKLRFHQSWSQWDRMPSFWAFLNRLAAFKSLRFDTEGSRWFYSFHFWGSILKGVGTWFDNMGCWPLRFPVINEWACALMCASHAEDGCCTYKDNAKRVDDENDGDNYEAPWGNELKTPSHWKNSLPCLHVFWHWFSLVRFFQPAPAKTITSKNTLVQ